MTVLINNETSYQEISKQQKITYEQRAQSYVINSNNQRYSH